MRVFVTGATGFVGSHLVDELLSTGKYEVMVLRRKTSNLRWLKNKPVEFVLGEVRDKNSLREPIRRADIVVHAAGVVKAKDWNSFFVNNVMGTKNVVEVILEENPNLKRFMFVSSQAVSRPSSTPVTEDAPSDPQSLYGRSKHLAELEARKLIGQVPTTIIRPASVFGPRDTEFLPLFKAVDKHLYPIIGGNKKKVSMVFVKDLVKAMVLALESDKAVDQTYFVCDEEPKTWKELFDAIKLATGKKFFIPVIIPMWAITLVGLVNTGIAKVTGLPIMLTYQKVREIKQDWVCSAKKIYDDLGFKTTANFQDAIKETYDWYKEQGWL